MIEDRNYGLNEFKMMNLAVKISVWLTRIEINVKIRTVLSKVDINFDDDSPFIANFSLLPTKNGLVGF